MDLKKSFSQNIKSSRKKHKLTQKELAKKAGITYKYVQKIEGKNTPNVGLELVGKLAKALKTTPAKLLDSK